MIQFHHALLAYLDPATGSLILQVFAAFIIASGLLLRNYLLAPIAWFRRRKQEDVDGNDDLLD